MTKLLKCRRVHIDNCRKSQIFLVKVKKIRFDKIWTKIDRTMDFYANHMHLIMGNYLVEWFL